MVEGNVGDHAPAQAGLVSSSSCWLGLLGCGVLARLYLRAGTRTVLLHTAQARELRSTP
jgi:hypothetical protein